MSMTSSATGLRHYLTTDDVGSAVQARAQRFYRTAGSLARDPLALAGLVIIAVFVLAGLFAPWIAPYSPTEINIYDRLQPPSADHWFGTDERGRDILSRVIHGARVTLYTVALAIAIVTPVGLTVGCVAGYFGGWVETVLMRLTDVFLAFPSVILALAFTAALGAGLENTVVAIGLASWPILARLAHAETIRVRRSDYVLAARTQGASAARILWRHIVPMCLPVVVIRLMLSVSVVILTVAALGFLGMGAQPPTPEWGAMLAQGRRYMLDHWWVVTVPGLAIVLVSLAFNLLGDGLRDALDPRRSAR